LLRRSLAYIPFPYTTLFRSHVDSAELTDRAVNNVCRCGHSQSNRSIRRRFELYGTFERRYLLRKRRLRVERGRAPRFGLLFEQRSEEHTSELQSRGHLVCRL